MNNVMTKGFCELNENEMMGVEGGGIQGLFNFLCGATAAQKRAEDQYNNVRQSFIDQMKNDPGIVTSIPSSAYSYFNLPDGGSYSQYR
jgi:bacteriocin-like protein